MFEITSVYLSCTEYFKGSNKAACFVSLPMRDIFGVISWLPEFLLSLQVRILLIINECVFLPAADPCTPNRCQNGGVCHQPGRCECPEGYDGRFCEQGNQHFLVGIDYPQFDHYKYSFVRNIRTLKTTFAWTF